MPEYYEPVIVDWADAIVDSQAQIVQCMREAFVNGELESSDDSAIRHIVGLSFDAAITHQAHELDVSQRFAVADAYPIRDISEIQNLIARNPHV